MNKNIKIGKKIILAIMLFVSIISCDDADFIDLKPEGITTDGEQGGLEAQVFGLYSQLRTEGGISDWTRYWFQSIRSDDAAKGSSVTDAATLGNILDGFNYTASEGLAASNWNGHYKLIFACNDIITEIDNSGATDANTLINKAEASVIRAFAYFDLRRDFGEVPIVLNKVVLPIDGIKAKSTIAQVDAQIISDLSYAIEHLPLSWPSYPGRATKGFANTLLAKLYLYQGDWANALSKSQEVIDSGQYSLNSSYAKIFSKDGNNSSESIFEIQFLRQGTTNYSNNYWESQGVRGSGSWDLGWGFNVPTSNLLSAYESGDPRYNATILTSGQNDGFGNIVPIGLDQIHWNKKAFTDPAERAEYGENKNHWSNIKILRYADVLLMAAEAANELGNSSTALNYLEMIRVRARSGANVLPTITSTDQTFVRNAIKQERRIEFALEGERFYDLVRWGDANTVLSGLGYQSRNQYYPIPQTAIDQAGGILIQNPNY